MSVTYETSFTMRRATGVIHQRHQILRLPRKMTLKIHPAHIWNVIYNARSNRHHPPTSPNTAPATQNDSQDSSCSHMKRHLQCAEQQASPSNLTKYCACHAKWLSWLILLTYETSFTMRGATGINLQPHQILRLPRKIAFQKQRESATQNDSQDSSCSHMKRHLQCAEQQASPSNLTKYCACHAKLHSKIKEKFAENSWSLNSNAGTIRTWSEHDPTMNSSSRTRPFAEVTIRASETHFVLKITTFRAPAIYPNFIKYCACHEKWHSNITKCCACHEKWCTSLIVVTYATSFTMRGATGITLQPHQMLLLPQKLCASLIVVAYETSFTMRRATGIALQPHQILRLPRKMTLMIDLRHIWNVIYNAQSNRHYPPTSPNTAPATQNDSHDWSSSHMKRHLQCAEQQASPSNLTKYCACHAKVHSKI